MFRKILFVAIAGLLVTAPLVIPFGAVSASSHREAPLISQDPLADNTDLYAFISPDNPSTVTIIANYIPMEDPASGPGFWKFDPNVLYTIYVDNTGDGVPDIAFNFRFTTTISNLNTFLPYLGNPGTGSDGTVGGDAVISSLSDPDFNVKQTYSLSITGPMNLGPFGIWPETKVLGSNFVVPPPNIGPGATPNYQAKLASQAVYNLPNGINVFAGQRDDPFFADLGSIFDRLELRPLGLFGSTQGLDGLAGFNTHSICLQIPIQMLTSDFRVPTSPTASDAVIGIWAAASRPAMSVLQTTGAGPVESGPYVQVSRLGNPLVNELFSPLSSRDKWNASQPANDIQFQQTEVIAPEVPALLNLLYGTNATGSGVVARALKPFPTTNRTDLSLLLYQGVPVNPVTGPNYTTVIGGNINNAVYSDQLRLNLAISPTAGGPLPSMASPGIRRLGILGGDPAGYPNGRRLYDDTVDIFLRVAAGGTPFTSLLFTGFSGATDPNVAPNNALTDGVDTNQEGFLPTFPYVQTPTSGFNSPHATPAPPSP
jgi:hypothetical protein